MSRRVLLALTATLAVGAAGGCASSGTEPAAAPSPAASATGASPADPSSAAASSSAAVCHAADDLRTSITGLQQVDVLKQGTDAVVQAFAQVKTDITDLAGVARDKYAAKVQQVKTDRDTVQTAIDAAKAAPGAQTLRAVGTAVKTLGTDVQSLLASIGTSC